jgi:hypothetical protein
MWTANTSNGNVIETKAERSFDLGFEPAYSRTCKDRRGTLLVVHLRKVEAKQILFIPQI